MSMFLFRLILIFKFSAVLGLCCCGGPSPVVARGGHAPAAVHELLLAVAPLVVSTRASVAAVRFPGSRHIGSVVVVHGLSCSMASGNSPDQGLNPHPLHW